MAPPPIPASINASTSSSVCTSSRAHGAVKYADTSDDNIRMDDQDEHTLRQTRLVSKKHGVVSPGLQGPSAQRVRVDDSVCHKYFIWISELTIPCRMLVGHVKISIKNAGRLTALACKNCTISRIACWPLAKWAHELEPAPLPPKGKAPPWEKVPTRQGKGKGKKQNDTGAC